MPSGRFRGTLEPLNAPLFRRLWLTTMFNNTGTAIQTLGATWLMTSLAPAPSMVALVQASAALPLALFALPAGALADIWDRRRQMLLAQAAMFIVVLSIIALTLLHLLTPWVLLTATFLIATGGAIHAPAWHSAIRQMVPRSQFDEAVALNSVSVNVARSIGPALGGAIVGLFGAVATFIVNLASYPLLIALLLRWRPDPSSSTLPKEGIAPAIVSGLRYVLMSPVTFGLLLRSALFGFGGSALWALMPIIARDGLHGGPLVYGFLFSALGCGAILGSFLRPKVRHQPNRAVDYGVLACGAACCLSAVNTYLVVALPVMFVAGVSWIVVLGVLGIAAQKEAPRWVVGRVVALVLVFSSVGVSLGSVMWGQVARLGGLMPAMTAAGLFLILTQAFRRHYRLPKDVDQDLTPEREEPSDPIEGPIAAEAGPVELSLVYRVDPADSDAFAAAMARLGRMRRRDGARRWRLSRDIDRPDRWIERFESPSWIDHLRRQTRPTIADKALRDEIARLHRGDVTVARTLIVDYRAANYRQLDVSAVRQGDKGSDLPDSSSDQL